MRNFRKMNQKNVFQFSKEVRVLVRIKIQRYDATSRVASLITWFTLGEHLHIDHLDSKCNIIHHRFKHWRILSVGCHELRWTHILVNNQNVTNYARRFKMMMQNIRKMIINMSINDNFFILYFHLNLVTKFEQYREHYVQIHEIVLNESNSIKNINYAINRFLNICVNRSISKKSTFVMIVITFVSNSFFDKIQSNAQLKIKNVVIIIVKMCIICDKKYHTTNEHREQFNFKRDRDQFDEERDDRDNKRKRENDNDDDERFNSKIDHEEKKYKIYIIINFAILTIINVMFR
jgi:hypothetical protein